jgi:hypothetical protein
VKEDATNVELSVNKTPAIKRVASHTGLTETGTIIYAQDMETQIAAEARGVTRKNIPWDTFHSTYLCDFSIKAQSKLTQGSQQAKTHAYEMYAIWELHACEMAYGRGTHMRDTPMR